MIIFDEERPSDSPFVERIWRSHSEGTAPFLSIALSRCELVVTKLHGKITMTVRGPETKATPCGDSPSDGEWFAILLKLGTHLVHLPTRSITDTEVTLPEATRNTFWLSGSAWEFPTYDNAEVFVNRLVRAGLLTHDPLIEATLHGQIKDLTPRSVQYHFLQATGITQNIARQIERARYATLLLQQGVSIPDTMLEAGYYDQPHLTRSLQRFIGQTPAELLHHSRPEQLSFLYKTTPYL
jgi:AraC-like DNA-binding protein